MAKKKKTAGALIRGVVLVIAITILGFSSYQLVQIFQEYRAGAEEYEGIRQYVEAPDGQSGNAKNDGEASKGKTAPKVDFDSLQQINPDVIGWLRVEAVPEIDYPIVQGTDNDYYLKHTFEDKKNSSGAIFLDYTNTKEFMDCNSFVYGHNMKNGSMFGQLKKFKDVGVYESSPYFWICTPKGNYLYEIFSYHTTSSTGQTYTTFSEGGTEFKSYLDTMKAESEIENNVELSEQDKIVTLSTCTGDTSTRFVVQGKRLPGVY